MAHPFYGPQATKKITGSLKVVRFGPFTFDPVAGELRKNGTKLRLQNTPARLLQELVAVPGVLRTREELRQALWPNGTFVDFENNLNNAIARLRSLLDGGSYIETVPRRGYRFRDVCVVPTAAEQAWLKGRHFWNRTTNRDLLRAIAYFEQAIEADPEYPPAYSGLACAHVMFADDVLDGVDAANGLLKAEAVAKTALALNENSAEAHACLAMVEWRLRWDWQAAEELFLAAIGLAPDYATAHQFYSWLLQATGRREESAHHMFRALECDPVSSFVGANVGWMLYLSGECSQAISHLRDTVALNEHYPLARIPLGLALQQAGRPDRAILEFERAIQDGGDSSYYQATLAQSLAACGRSREARSLLDRWRQAPGFAFDRAIVYAGLREDERAMDCLRQALNERSSQLGFLQVDPLFERPRRKGLLKPITREIGLS